MADRTAEQKLHEGTLIVNGQCDNGECWCYEKPEVRTSNEQVYRCFHCDEEFRGIDAENHFGRNDNAEPACKIKAAGEFALLQALRNAEDELIRRRAEDSDVLRAMHSMIADHQVALRREEEKGYARGLRDAVETECDWRGIAHERGKLLDNIADLIAQRRRDESNAEKTGADALRTHDDPLKPEER